MLEEPTASLAPDLVAARSPTGVRRVIAVGGGRGGVGKSVLAISLGVYIAQLGRSVLLVDADPAGAELHTLLGLEFLSNRYDEEEGEDLKPVPSQVPGLFLLPQSYRTGSTVPVRPGRKPRWLRRLRELEVDYLLLDLGAGTQSTLLDLFLSAEIGICVATPEPPSVEASYRFARALFLRVLRRVFSKDRFRLRLVERAEQKLGPLPAPQDLVRTLAGYDSAVASLAAAELSLLRPRLVVNGTRLRSHTELGPTMVDMAERYLGVAFDYVGHIEEDDAVWLSVAHRRPLLIDGPASKSARNVERIARRILALTTTRERVQPKPIGLLPVEPNLYEVLWTHRSATDEDLRRAYKRLREIYQPASLPLTSLLSEPRLRLEQTRVEEAHNTLLDPLRRKAYDASVFPGDQTEQPAKRTPTSGALEAERAMLREELAREITAETEFTGQLLRKIRESQGVEIEDIAKQTRIAASHLHAIEAEDFGELPALVYTRGFVQQLAGFLKLDPAQVSKSYLRRLRDYRALSERDSGA